MLRVHHLNNSRSQRVLWLLEEPGLPYEIVRHQRDAQTNLAPAALLAVHPLGKAPVLEDGGNVVIESGAILEYVVRKYGEGRLAPADPMSADGLLYLQLMHYAVASAMLPVLLKLYVSRLGEAGAGCSRASRRTRHASGLARRAARGARVLRGQRAHGRRHPALLRDPGRAHAAGNGSAGARCAGAAPRLCGGISREQLSAALAEELEPLGPAVIEKNLGEALAAFDAMAPHAGVVRESTLASARDFTAPDWSGLPLDLARTAAPDIYAPATNVAVRTGLWRSIRPEIDYAHCNRCTWVCATLCPDSAIRVRADRSPEIDLQHCKGCMICVSVCPPHAVHAIAERVAQAREAAQAAA